MKNFWPYRSAPIGFSIEGLARKYREKVSGMSSETGLNGIVNASNPNLERKWKKEIFRSPCGIGKSHWANRDFSEYFDVA